MGTYNLAQSEVTWKTLRDALLGGKCFYRGYWYACLSFSEHDLLCPGADNSTSRSRFPERVAWYIKEATGHDLSRSELLRYWLCCACGAYEAEATAQAGVRLGMDELAPT